LPGMVSYYLIVTIVDTLTSVTDDDWQIAGDIKDGNISQFLLKPINYTIYRLSLFLSGKVIFAAMSFVPLGIFYNVAHFFSVLTHALVVFFCGLFSSPRFFFFFFSF